MCSVLVGQEKKEKKGARKWGGAAGSEQNLERLGRGEGRYQIHRRIEDTGGLAGFNHTAGGVRENARQTGGITWQDVQGDGVAPHRSGINPGKGAFHGVIIDQIAGFEIVSSIYNQRHSLK